MKLNKIILLFLILLMVGCDSATTSSTTKIDHSETSIETTSAVLTYNVTFDSVNDTNNATYTYKDGSRISVPDNPLRTGYTFQGWYVDPSHSEKWDFINMVVHEDTTLYAMWTINQYTVIFVDEYYHVLDSVTADYGSTISTPSVTNKIGYRFFGWVEDDFQSLPTVVDSKMPAVNVVVHPKWMVENYELPVLSINLEIPITSVNREEYVEASISLENTSDTYVLEHVSALFRGRGNGSWWNYDKKGYRIKFDEKQSLLGEDESRHWVIIPGTYDYSSVRNYYAYKITTDVLDGIEYTTSAHLIDVYVNGNYYGVYTLCEQVRVETGRVDIESEYGVIDTGYLLEYDSYAAGTDGIDYFYVPGLRYGFSVKSPDPEEYSLEVSETLYRAQISYIKNYTNELIQAILNKNFTKVAELADMNSLVDMYIIQELFKNTDTGWSSFYMYKKPGGKMFFGPVWDFDFSAGVSRGDSTVEGFYVSDTVRYYSDYTASEIYISLMQQQPFVDLFIQRYLNVSEAIENEIILLSYEIAQYDESFARDAIVWPWESAYGQEQTKVYQWLINRNDWLTNWAKNESE